MTACESIGSPCRELPEIDALMRSLRALSHWSGTATAREAYRDDRGRRLHATAATLRDEAWADSLHAAYVLFEVDALYTAWIESDGRRD